MDIIIRFFIYAFLVIGLCGLIGFFIALFEYKHNKLICIKSFKDSASFYTISYISFIICLILTYIDKF